MGKPEEAGELIWLAPAWSIKTQRDKAEARYDRAWDQCGEQIAQLFGDQSCWASRMKEGECFVDEWIVEGMYQRGEVAMVVGESNVGKTFVLLDLAIAIAQGSRWLNKFECFTGPVVFVSGESKRSRLERRINGLLTGRNTDLSLWARQTSKRFQLHRPLQEDTTSSSVLSSDIWWNKIKSFVKHVREHGNPEMLPRAFIFDPIMALLSDVNDPAIANKFIDNCRWLAENADCAVILGHHFRKSQQSTNSHSDRIHGPAAYRNLLDNILVLSEDPKSDHFIHAWSNKFRDGEKGRAERPAFHIARNFEELPYAEVLHLVRQAGGEISGMESPKAIQRIELFHVEYSEDMDPSRDDDDNEGSDLNVGECSSSADIVPIAPDVVSEALHVSEWDDRHLLVVRAMRGLLAPATSDQIYEATKDIRGDLVVGRSTIQKLLTELVAFGAVVTTSTRSKRSGTAYKLSALAQNYVC